MNPAVLTYVRLAAQAIQAGECAALVLTTPTKRPRRSNEEKIETGYKIVKPDYRRESLFVVYCTVDGRKKRKYRTPAEWSGDAISQTAEELIMWLKENHFVKNDDGTYVRAALIVDSPHAGSDEDGDDASDTNGDGDDAMDEGANADAE